MSAIVEATDWEREFERAVPGGFYVDPARPEALERHLRALGVLARGEGVSSVGRAGEGNMNLTLRVVTSDRSLVL